MRKVFWCIFDFRSEIANARATRFLREPAILSPLGDLVPLRCFNKLF